MGNIVKSALAVFAVIGVTSNIQVLPFLTGAVPASAQTNNNPYTPLGSRIRRDRPYPNEPRSMWKRRELTELGRTRSRNMLDYFGTCLWNRSNEDGLDLLGRTDFGFGDWRQIGIEPSEVPDHYAISQCLRYVARRNNTGVRLSYNAEAMRRWYLYEAYVDHFPEGPDWIVPGYVVGERSYPVSANDPTVHSAMNLADCVVSQAPYEADYFFRTGEDSEEEAAAVPLLIPALEACVLEGQQLDITPFTLRVWLGEGLWHAANTMQPPEASGGEGDGEVVEPAALSQSE